MLRWSSAPPLWWWPRQVCCPYVCGSEVRSFVSGNRTDTGNCVHAEPCLAAGRYVPDLDRASDDRPAPIFELQREDADCWETAASAEQRAALGEHAGHDAVWFATEQRQAWQQQQRAEAIERVLAWAERLAVSRRRD
jgi:hypothetical protein